MGAADMMEDGFPHGTRDGYDQGCRGSHCPAAEDGFLSCTQARTRYHSDYAYKKRVDAGLSLAELAAADDREAEEQRARLVAARAARDAVRSAAEPDDDERSAIARAESSGIAYERHGTASGYSAGCRDKESCPGIVRVGKSCTQAVNEYQRDRKRARREERAANKAAVTPTPVPVEDVAEDRAVDVEAEALREQLAAEAVRADAAVQDVAVLEEKLDAALARNRELTDRVASLEMELDVAKSAAARPPEKVLGELQAVQDRRLQLVPEVPASSRFRFQRDEQGGVVVDVDGPAPGFVRFEVDEAGALTGVAVQSGKGQHQRREKREQ